MNIKFSVVLGTLLLFKLLFTASFVQALHVDDASKALHFGVLSIAPPSRTYKKWQPFVDYVSAKMAHPIDIVVPRGFKKMKKLAAKGEVDFFYINAYVMYRLKQEGKAIGILQMKNIKGDIISHSEIFVRKDSDIQNIKQLNGRDIAYVSPMGAGGYLAPKAYLKSHGVTSGKGVKEKFTKNLSTSIHNVLLKDNIAGTMCGVNFSLMSKKMEMGELRVLAVSDAYPENLIAARSSLDANTINKFKQIVSNMNRDPEGKRILAGMYSMKIKDLIPYDPDIEKITKKLILQAGLTP